jgi:hypothetical protein
MSRRPLSRLRSAASEAATACWPHASLKRTHSTILAAHLVRVRVRAKARARARVRI